MAARRGGCVYQEISRSDRNRRSRGGFPFAYFLSENHPGCALTGSFAIFFCCAHPPLLAVMQGGDYLPHDSRLISHLSRPPCTRVPLCKAQSRKGLFRSIPIRSQFIDRRLSIRRLSAVITPQIRHSQPSVL